ncbi:DUF485 domain-containing protein [Streptomyces sp. CA-288835]|uniref:DUF485 domain-containing protein n=1 Tax=Streptomyces sp. CA-288835 TaxID=3240069 RepID=UPI003D8BA709
MDSRDLFPAPEQDPPAAAALYLSTLDHEGHYSAVELQQAIARAQRTIGPPADLSALYRQSFQGASAFEHDVRARRRSWALRMTRHLDLTLDDRRPVAAVAPAWAAWEEPVIPSSEIAPRTPAPSPAQPADPESYLRARQPAALRELRAARRRPALIAATVLAAHMTGVVLANEAPDLMAIDWAGPLNIGLTLVLAQVTFTGWAVLWYVRYAKSSLEPLVKRHSAAIPHQHQESDR